MCRCCAWVQKRVVGTKAQTHGPGRSIPMFKSQVQRPLDYPGAPPTYFYVWYKYISSRVSDDNIGIQDLNNQPSVSNQPIGTKTSSACLQIKNTLEHFLGIFLLLCKF